jgi:putative (di)nucleoside polyphosphate hydrolase
MRAQVRQSLYGSWKRFKGQKQRWYLAHFYGDDSEINLLTEHKEFKAWKW